MYWTNRHVLICNASHCASKGANDVAGRMRLEIIRRKLDAQILINNCGTIDLCDIGPNIVVYPDNVILSGVKLKDVGRVVDYLAGGEIPEDLVLNRETKATATRGPWIYNGSNFSEGAFTAERDGSIISIHIDADALINNPRPGRENDDLHVPNAAKLPPLGTAVEIRIHLERP